MVFHARLVLRLKDPMVRDFFTSLYQNFSIARIIYSLILIAIIFLIAGHLVSIWSQGKILISNFSYYSNGKSDADRAGQLRGETLSNYSMILDLIRLYETTERSYEDQETSKENGIENDTNKPQKLQVPAESRLRGIADTIEISVGGVNVKGIFSAFSSAFTNFIAPPETELVVSIYDSQEAKRAYVGLVGDSADQISRQLMPPLPLFTGSDAPSSDADNAFRIACYLIWIQVNQTRHHTVDDSQALGERISLSEFCNWAKMLIIWKSLIGTDQYQLETRKKSLDIEFIRRQVLHAVRLDTRFYNIYVSLSDLIGFVSDDTILLNQQTTVKVDDVSELIKYFAITRPDVTDDPGSRAAWLDQLPPSVTGRQSINQAYFKQFIGNCNRSIGPPVDVGNKAPNIVQISTTINPHAPRTIITTGLIIEDGKVLTLFPGRQGSDKPNEWFKSSTVRLLECGHPEAPVKVKSATIASNVGKSPYAILSVPQLKRRADNPDVDFDGLANGIEGSEVYIVGNISDTAQMFSGRPPSANDHPNLSDEMIYFISGKVISEESSLILNDERSFLISAPFARGLTGAPIFDIEGQLIGFVNSGRAIGRNLLMVDGSSIYTLKGLQALKKQ